MSPDAEARYKRALDAPLTWQPTDGGKPGLVCFADTLERSFGADPTGEIFEGIAAKMISGHYYPADVIQTYGEFQTRGTWQVGDRVLQKSTIFFGIALWSAVEVFAAEKTENACRIGYVTTAYHHGRGIWQATLTRGEELSIKVEGTACPQSWLFWLGLPYARYAQRRAWRKALDQFQRLADELRSKP